MLAMQLKPVLSYDHQILSEMNAAYARYVKTSKQDPARLATIRASALPFCPLGYLYQKFLGRNELDASGAYYTSVGTTVHTWIQEVAGSSGLVLGDWKKGDKWRRFSLYPGPGWEYHELEVEVLGAVGHVDGVICLDRHLAQLANKKKSRTKRIAAFKKVPLFVVDYKTCSVTAVKSKVAASSKMYVTQLLLYCLYFHELGMKVRAYGNFYIPRDNPSRWGMNMHKWTPKDHKYITKMVKHWVKLHASAMKVKTWRQVQKVLQNGLCENPYCKVCRSRNPQRVLRFAFDQGK